MSGDGGAFVVNSTTGVISTSAALNYESAQEYKITIRATDSGSPPRASTTTVIITITGVNEYTPQFTSNGTYTVNVSESLALGYDVITVSANDPDVGSQGEVTYTITFGDVYGNFVIDSKTGVIELVSALDYEISSQITLTISATDGDSGSPLSAQAFVTVNVIDFNDNYPECVPSLLTPAILESAAVGDVVATLNCSDPDTGNYGQLSYTISLGNSNGKDAIAVSRPFAANSHMVQNPPCWRASYALGHPKQRKFKFDWMKSLCFGCPQHGGYCTM